MNQENEGRRRRSSSILQVYHEPPETLEQISDQAALPNLNANWTGGKGKLSPLKRSSGPAVAYRCHARDAQPQARGPWIYSASTVS